MGPIMVVAVPCVSRLVVRVVDCTASPIPSIRGEGVRIQVEGGVADHFAVLGDGFKNASVGVVRNKVAIHAFPQPSTMVYHHLATVLFLDPRRLDPASRM